jgi:hypothetical protein
VTIVDSLTSEPLASVAAAIVSEGAYVDTLQPCRYDSLGREVAKCGAYERAGTYSLRVTVTGYREWNRSEIRVEGLQCGVETAVLEARLMPDSQLSAVSLFPSSPGRRWVYSVYDSIATAQETVEVRVIGQANGSESTDAIWALEYGDHSETLNVRIVGDSVSVSPCWTTPWMLSGAVLGAGSPQPCGCSSASACTLSVVDRVAVPAGDFRRGYRLSIQEAGFNYYGARIVRGDRRGARCRSCR